SVDSANLGAVAELCRRLDGIPLALELAAARTAAMEPADIVDRLDNRFRLLTGGRRGVLERHQTLRAAIDWSYMLLDDDERALLGQLSTFVGSFDLPAVLATSGREELETIDLLTSLVAKSLVERPVDRGGRYRLLETIRQYALERLDEEGMAAAARDRHAD